MTENDQLSSAAQSEPGTVYTFYSFKGGVGRSMALANIAALLSKWRRRVLVLDWDLEAPGIEKYFESKNFPFFGSRKKTSGIVDLIYAHAEGRSLAWTDCLLTTEPFPGTTPVSIISAGRNDESYYRRVQQLDWNDLFAKRELGQYIENLRNEWIREFEFVLVDSRTGITDIGGICTVHLPDILVVFFITNEQSLDGVVDVVRRARVAHQKLPFDRYHLPVVPIASRDESRTEHEMATHWRGIFASRLNELYEDWLPKEKRSIEALERLRLPYIPYWSFGERLPVVERGTSDPQDIGFAYELIARLIASRLDWKAVQEGSIEISEEQAGAVAAKDAEAMFHGLTKEQQGAARRLLIRLVHVAQPGEEVEDRRRSVRLNELDDELRAVVPLLGRSRIVVVEPDPAAGTERIQLADTGLIRAWERFRGWLAEDRDFLLWRQQLRSAIREWERLGRDPAALLRGAALEQAERVLIARPSDLTSVEEAFVEASATQQREAVTALVQRRRRTAFAAAFAIAVLVVSAVSGVWFLSEQRSVALAERLALQAELLLNQAELLLKERPDRVELAALLALEAQRRYPSPEAAQVVATALSLLPRLVAELSFKDTVDYLVLSPLGDQLLVQTGDGGGRLWNVGSASSREIADSEIEITAAAFSPDGERLLTASADGMIRLWSTYAGELLANLEADTTATEQRNTAPVSSAAFSPDGRKVVTGSRDGIARVWSTDSGEVLVTLMHQAVPVVAVAFGPEDRLVATASLDGTIWLWNADAGDLFQNISVGDTPFEEPVAVAFGPDGRRVILGSRDGQILLWDISGQEVSRLPLMEGRVRKLTLSSNGRYVATDGPDDMARVWNLEAQTETARVALDSTVTALAFSPDEELLATGTLSGRVQLWRWGVETPSADPCERLTRNLTKKEWEQYLGSEPYRATCPTLPTSDPAEQEAASNIHREGQSLLWQASSSALLSSFPRGGSLLIS